MRALIVFAVFALIVSCNSAQRLPETPEVSTAQDSTQYEMIVMEPGFEVWFAANSKPGWYHSQDYYENWNRQYTHAWNAKVNSFPYGHLLNNPINYEDDIDYGLEINHKLFYYFQYVERVLRIPVLREGPGYVTGF